MPAASGCLRLRVDPRGSPLLALRWRALASRSGAERCAWDPLALLLGLRAVAMVSVPLRRLTHRLPGDLLFTLLSGLISTASRRNLTNHFIAWRQEPCSQSGSQACALAPVSSRLPSSQGTLAHICPALRPRPDRRARRLALRCCSRRHKGESSSDLNLSRLHHTAFVPAAYA